VRASKGGAVIFILNLRVVTKKNQVTNILDGGTPLKGGWGCSTRNFKIDPKRYQVGRELFVDHKRCVGFEIQTLKVLSSTPTHFSEELSYNL